jgi:hypothetical protein
MDDDGLKEDWKTRSKNYNRQLKIYHPLTTKFGVPFILAKDTQTTIENLVMP